MITSSAKRRVYRNGLGNIRDLTYLGALDPSKPQDFCFLEVDYGELHRYLTNGEPESVSADQSRGPCTRLIP